MTGGRTRAAACARSSVASRPRGRAAAVAAGTPERIAMTEGSHTGRRLRPVLCREQAEG